MELRERAQPPRRRYQPPVTYRWEPAPATPGPWRIIFGIHDGTWAGRDQDMPRDTEYATWDAAKAAMQTQIHHFRTLGCAICLPRRSARTAQPTRSCTAQTIRKEPPQ